MEGGVGAPLSGKEAARAGAAAGKLCSGCNWYLLLTRTSLGWLDADAKLTSTHTSDSACARSCAPAASACIDTSGTLMSATA